MRRNVLAVTAAVLMLAGCEDMSHDERVVAGGLAGAAVGMLTADMLDADADWIVISALGGAAIGALVAHNRRTGECAYAWYDSRYRVGPCPRNYRWRYR